MNTDVSRCCDFGTPVPMERENQGLISYPIRMCMWGTGGMSGQSCVSIVMTRTSYGRQSGPATTCKHTCQLVLAMPTCVRSTATHEHMRHGLVSQSAIVPLSDPVAPARFSGYAVDLIPSWSQHPITGLPAVSGRPLPENVFSPVHTCHPPTPCEYSCECRSPQSLRGG